MNEPSPNGNKPLSSIKAGSGLTHSQIQIWTGQQVHPQSPFCNMAFAYVIDGKVDEQRFQRAWNQVIEMNPVLRSSIRLDFGSPKREGLDTQACATQLFDFSDQADPEAAFYELAKQQSATLMKMDGPLIESKLVKLAVNRYGWFLNQHHLITDASSTIGLFKAISSAYSADQKAETSAPKKQYFEIAAENEASARDTDYWLKKAEQFPIRNNPIYGRESDQNVTSSERIQINLTEEQSKAIRDLSAHESFAAFFPDISIYAVFSTLLAALLNRVSSQDRVSFDSPAGNRPNRASKKSLGCFIEMFPLDLELADEETFASLGAKALAEIQDFLSNSGPGLSAPSGATTSNAVLNYFPQSFGNFADLPVKANWIHSGHIDGVYDLKLQVHDYNGTGAFVIQFDLSDTTFSQYDRRRIPAHFMALLAAATKAPDTQIDQVDILTSEERERTLVEFNNCSSPTRSGASTVIDLIAEHVATSPDSTALREGSRSMTYGELWQASEVAAKGIQAKVDASNDCVAILLPRSLELVVAILGCLRAGQAYAPIDPKYPANRIERIIQDSDTQLVIAEDQKRISGTATLSCETLQSLQIAGKSISSELPKIGLKDLAYVIYTSGSTGQPKGVEIEHEGLLDYIQWAEREYVRGEKLVYPLFTSLAFDLTVTSLFLPFVTGGSLVVYPQLNDAVDHGVIDVINDNAVDFIKLTPSHLSLLRNLDLSQSKIRRLVLGGEDLKQSLADEVCKQFPQAVELYNEYGPTEAVVGCMIHRHEIGHEGLSVPIGRPADGVSIHLLNSAGTPVPEGTPGEIFIERIGLARGYRNDPEKTASSFLESSITQGRRTYKTGDLARFSQRGELSYLGRIDSQIKRSGFRIELGEIESAIASHPEIRSAYVTLTKPNAGVTVNKDAAHCVRCGISSQYPSIVFNEQGVCSVCSSYDSIKDEAQAYFKKPEELRELFESRRTEKNSGYDCMVFFSGGKDSAYALCQLVDMGLRVYAFTLDNGYLSEQAMDNIRRVTEALGVEHEFAQTESMNEIFRDSLTRFSNVCNGCFKTIYTLGINRAHELGIPTIVTGLSRGQFFETRLTENLFVGGRFNPEQVDLAVLEARKNYHRTQDAVTRCLDNSLFETDDIFEEIIFVDFYRYWSAPLEEIYRYLSKRVPWIKPSDTGRSTNCRVNDVGIYIHNKERGFHNYALPYSWDVRLDQKRRDEAKEELEDHFDTEEVKTMLSEIGYDENRLEAAEGKEQLVAYYVSPDPIPPSELISTVDKYLPPQLRPNYFVQVPSMPLTTNGKIDVAALPAIDPESSASSKERLQPTGEVEEHVFEVWATHLGTRQFGVDDSFFQIGGVSLAAMEITLQLCNDFQIDLPLQSIFQFPTVAQLSEKIEEIIFSEIEGMDPEEVDKLLQSEQ
ncbi:non-ribosomal peptide synthetase [Pelagicoccus albus]|uniref:Amino acid adenylation domain-containing protein n=1 Tax=Pelagicoccus albus TaxID=415222 RepID=A0A7X1B9D3_9BACT|nr:non-ribosomal peptide synthetase [Pelagicoccus albus]MBC2607981.1 amino acid adenylation domain-containing protein [Pelagicoccus albus]